MYEQKDAKKQMTQWKKKFALDCWHQSAIIRKVSQEEQQNQTKTTNINYIQNLSPLFFYKKKLLTRSE